MKYTISALIIAVFSLGAIPAQAATVPAGSLIRGTSPAVYYITADGKRLAFPNASTYFTWYKDFSTVKFVNDRELASYPLAGNVTYRPGTRLLKLSSASTVYAVAHGGVLRPIMTQGAAVFAFGSNWPKLVDDLSDAFFVNYKVGNPIYLTSDYLPATEQAASLSISADRQSIAVAPSAALKVASLGPTTVSGRMISLAVDPANENAAYAGSASGGVWKTTDMGRNWTALNTRLSSMHIGALAIDPVNNKVIYAGTGETYMPGDDWAYAGIYVSTDSGATWTLLNGTADLKLSAVSSIAIDPKNTARIYVSGNTGIYATSDRGASWKKLPLEGFVEQVMVSDLDHETLFATGSQTSVWRSKDAGATWIKLVGWNANRGLPDDNAWFNRVTITQSSGQTLKNTTSNHVLYVAMADPFRLFRSDSEGESWYEVSRQTYNEKNFAVLADPNDADVVFTAGGILRRATEGGWKVNVLPLQYTNIRAVAFAPSNPKIMYAATDNGMEVSVNGGLDWQPRSNGLNTTQWHSIALSADGSTAYGAVADRSLVREQRGGVWYVSSWGTAREIVADPTRDLVVYALASDKGIGRSSDAGQSFSPVNGNLPSGDKLAHLAVNPVNAGFLYVASGANVYGTNDSGANWYLFGNGNNSSNVTSIAVSALNQKVYVGRADGSIDELSAFGGATVGARWSNIYREGNKKAVAELSAVGGTVTAAFDANWGTRIGRLVNTTGSWVFTDLTGNMPEGAWPLALAVDPANQNVVYVSHLAGAFRGVSADGKAWSWSRTEDGLPEVMVTDIAISPATGRVYYATWGRGLYEVKQ